jgi:hypothetical protein
VVLHATAWGYCYQGLKVLLPRGCKSLIHEPASSQQPAASSQQPAASSQQPAAAAGASVTCPNSHPLHPLAVICCRTELRAVGLPLQFHEDNAQ